MKLFIFSIVVLSLNILQPSSLEAGEWQLYAQDDIELGSPSPSLVIEIPIEREGPGPSTSPTPPAEIIEQPEGAEAPTFLGRTMDYLEENEDTIADIVSGHIQDPIAGEVETLLAPLNPHAAIPQIIGQVVAPIISRELAKITLRTSRTVVDYVESGTAEQHARVIAFYTMRTTNEVLEWINEGFDLFYE